MQSGLTPRQLDLLEYLRDFIRREGHSPSFQQMLSAVDLKSKSGIHRLVDSLEERGYIRRLHNRARAIVLIDEPDRLSHAAEIHLKAYCQRHRVSREQAVAVALESYFGGAV